MKIPKVSLLIPILILAISSGVIYTLVNNNSKTVDNTVPVIAEDVKPFLLVDMSLVEDKIYKEPTQYATFDISYPQFKDASDEFNKTIENMVTDAIHNHTIDSEESWKARYNNRAPGDSIKEFPFMDDKFQFGMSWKATQINKDFISVLITFYGYTGGAHGYQNMISFNYNVDSNKQMKLSDLFPNDPSYLKKVSEFSKKDLNTQFRKLLSIKTKEDEEQSLTPILYMLNDGTKPLEENFSVFTFTPEDINIYFTQYQVAPYAMGDFTVKMPRN